MSKEQLEEMLSDFRQLLALTVGNMDILNKAGEIHKLVTEQSERVQELEGDYEHLESIIDRVYFDRAREISRANELDRQNKRYREAIEKALHKCDLTDDTGHDYTNEIRFELRKALGVEINE